MISAKKIDIDAVFSEGLNYHMNGELRLAEDRYRAVLQNCPAHADSLHHLGLLHLQRGRIQEAVFVIKKSLALRPDQPIALSNLGHCFSLMGENIQAREYCLAAIEIDASNDAAWNNLGNAHKALGLYSEARDSYEQAFRLEPTNPRYIYNIAITFFDEGKYEMASTLLEKCLAIDNTVPEAHSSLSACYIKLQKFNSALKHSDLAISLKPDSVGARCNRGNSLHELKFYWEAVASYDQAIVLNPNYAEAWYNRGNSLYELKSYREAVASYDKAIALNPDYAEAWYGRGNSLYDTESYESALSSYDQAVALKPDCAKAWRNRGVLLIELKRYEEAILSYEKAYTLTPDADYLLGELVLAQMKICNWSNLTKLCQAIETKLYDGKRSCTPLGAIVLFDDPRLQRQCAEIYSTGSINVVENPYMITKKRTRAEKIKLGYFSMDFREHPVSHLIFDLIKLHDRSKFQVYGFSYGINTNDQIRIQLEKRFDSFFEVRGMSEIEIAKLSRDKGIDIAVDLGGYTLDSRPGIFSHRAAPIQINYLGFPGTLGAKCWDYFIGDSVTITEDNRENFSEKIIFLPDSFQPNPLQRVVRVCGPKNQAYHLPRDRFVFCCFNNAWKITPQVLLSWTRILRQVDESVLWLSQSSPTSTKNILTEFKRNQIDPSRIIFADRLPDMSDHLARYHMADLFVDTFPYGAHTTASDALWVGLPVLTRVGRSFASRVAASLLCSVELPQLITNTPEEYEALAIELATDPMKLKDIRKKLVGVRSTCALFNTHRFAQNLESAYQAVYSRHCAGLTPDNIYISSRQSSGIYTDC